LGSRKRRDGNGKTGTLGPGVDASPLGGGGVTEPPPVLDGAPGLGVEGAAVSPAADDAGSPVGSVAASPQAESVATRSTRRIRDVSMGMAL